MQNVTERGCKRCLLRDLADSGDILSQVEKTRKLMTKDERAEDDLYEKRLALCRECAKLVNATCLKCGCYVEIRALAKGASCPGRKW